MPVAQEESEEERLRKRRERDVLLDALEAEEAEEERLAQEALRAKRRNPNAPLNPKPFVPTPPPAKPLPAISPLGQAPPIIPKIVERPHASTLVTSPSTVAPPKPASSPAPNKQVSFAADTKPAATAASSSPVAVVENWGDVVPGRLRGAKHESLRAVHMDVVERAAPTTAAATDVGPSSTPQTQTKRLSFTPRKVQLRQVEVDSDDEPEDADEGGKGQEDKAEDGEDTPDEQEDDEEEDEDWDEAMLQRELALAYYEAQGILRGARESAEIPVAPVVSSDPGSWEQEVRFTSIDTRHVLTDQYQQNVPLDATLASSKTSFLRFSVQSRAHCEIHALKRDACRPIPRRFAQTWESCGRGACRW